MKTITKLVTLSMLFGVAALSADCCSVQPNTTTNTPVNQTEHTFRNPFSTTPAATTGAEQQHTGFFGNSTTTPAADQPRTSFFGNTPATPAADQSRTSFFGNSTPAANQQPTMQDSQLINRVRQALFNNRNIDARAIQVSSENGKVTLIGVVRNAADKDQALSTVQNVTGVSSVSDQLTTQPAPAMNH